MRSVKKIVTSTTVYVGEDGNLLEEKPENCQVLKVNNPILTNTDMLKIKAYESGRLQGSRGSDYLL